MAEELDVDALLDAPFKHGKVGDGQQTGAGANVSRQRGSRSRHRYDDDRDSRDRHGHSRRGADAMDVSPRGHDRDHRSEYDRAARDHRRPSRRSTSRQRPDSPLGNGPPGSRSASSERRHRRRSRGSRSPSQEHDGSERDLRTVFAMQLSARLRRSDLVEFFSKAGRVRDAQIVSEKGSRRSRGIAYIEFYAAASVVKAVELSGQRLLGVPIIVQPSEAEKNRRSTMKHYSTDGAPVDPLGSVNCLVLVRNLAVDIEPADLARFFELFGAVEHCHVAPAAEISDARDTSGWAAFVKLGTPVSACLAAERLDGLELFGARLRVRMARRPEQEHEQRRIAEERSERKDGAAVTEMPQMLLLRGMVDPSEETEPNWREELENDVGGECAKYGRVTKVVVDHGPSGDIHVDFADAAAARQAQQSMGGRWFGGRKIVAELVPAKQYQSRPARTPDA
ncbi:splicing factor [Coemansia biformis]|uniref:Splicing factor n=1 Tax=Coemansia biformis TaxID=1286918 RepID=A0A9W8CYH3_9FUNG|nr:splicing factor [Coemansia biformis]